MRTIEVVRGDAWPAWTSAAGLGSLDEGTWRQHGADLHLAILATVEGDAEEVVVARCSCWWSSVPSLSARSENEAADTGDGDERLGVIGHYAAVRTDAGEHLLREACARLRRAGCTRALGPMDGNTWRSYRLVIERMPGRPVADAARGDVVTTSDDDAANAPEPPFFLEPDTPAEWVPQFMAAGFRVLATYTSALARDLTRRDDRLTALGARLQRAGVTIRPLDPARADEELRRIHALSLVSFQDNFLYTPLDEAEFLEQNRRLLPFVRPELVLLAERGGELIGFLFAVPDVLRARRLSAEARRPASPDTIVIKTVAVRPGLTNAGLGSLLVAEVQQRAAALGFSRAVHALMHEQNVSRNISRRYAETIRRYALFEARLTPPLVRVD